MKRTIPGHLAGIDFWYTTSGSRLREPAKNPADENATHRYFAWKQLWDDVG